MGYGCDTATAVSTTSRLNAILNGTDQNGNHLTFVGRYINRVEGYQDQLTPSEVTRLSGAGLYIFSIWQKSRSVSYFTYAQGSSDAQTAVLSANYLGQTTGTPIYFAVDFDALTSDITNNIAPYFQGVNSVLSNSSLNPYGYKIGVYGSNHVCSYIKSTYSSSYTMVAAASTGWDGNKNYTFSSWNLKQTPIDQWLGGDIISVDFNESSSLGGGGWKL